MILNTISCSEASEYLNTLEDSCVDLTLTSPPYDKLRKYKGFNFPFEAIAAQLFRITKTGGIVAWVVGDQTVKGNESLTSFKQALYFQSLGFAVETMIFQKKNPLPSDTSYRYVQSFEYIFILTKGQPKTFNPLKVSSQNRTYPVRYKKGDFITTIDARKVKKGAEERVIGNIWSYSTTGTNMTKDKLIGKHPAMFPEALAFDVITSWSNEGDLILDPMCGSGTTCKVAKQLNRHFLGIDISQDYCNIAKDRLKDLGEIEQ